jgi:hypothetical protein
MQPLCFVPMPFGRKPGTGGAMIDFDVVYNALIKPAIEAADLLPLRADEAKAGGITHKPMFERLILCEFAVADLTTANANVFYELGVRHAVKPATTMLLYAADGSRLPFDLAPMRTLPYSLGPAGTPSAAEADRAELAQLLVAAKSGTIDSPVYRLVEGIPNIRHSETAEFRDRVEYSESIKDRLREARKRSVEAIRGSKRASGRSHVSRRACGSISSCPIAQ